jgi:hypothetical protein
LAGFSSVFRDMEAGTAITCCQCSVACQGFWGGFGGMLLILGGRFWEKCCDWAGR